MATKLKPLKGKMELSIDNDIEPIYRDTDINLTIFAGGKLRGKSLEIGFKNHNNVYSHVQLDNSTVHDLFILLRDNYILD